MLIKAGGKELLFQTDIQGGSALCSASQSGHAGLAKDPGEEGGNLLR